MEKNQFNEVAITKFDCMIYFRDTEEPLNSLD